MEAEVNVWGGDEAGTGSPLSLFHGRSMMLGEDKAGRRVEVVFKCIRIDDFLSNSGTFFFFMDYWDLHTLKVRSEGNP